MLPLRWLAVAAATTAAHFAVLAAPAVAYPTPPRPTPEMAGAPAPIGTAPIAWRRSRSLGVPWEGRLVDGLQLPAEGTHYFTWDPARKRSPNRPGRLWTNDRVLRIAVRVVADYARSFPNAPRLGIGDLSRREGGRFGPLHVSHQNGLDVDIYYPRLDRRERPPRRPQQVDLRLAQWLVDRVISAGASKVFVGPHLNLRGPKDVVAPLWNHDNHLHARFPQSFRRTHVIGRSAGGRALRVTTLGDTGAPRRLLVIGCIHGNECALTAITRRLLGRQPLERASISVVHTLNPDGRRLGTRGNARGVDLNRNFGAGWRPLPPPTYSGRRPFSEPETRAARRLLRDLRPTVTVWLHQPQRLVRAWGSSVPAGRRYARLTGMRFSRLRWPPGSAAGWQNTRLGQTSFVVELPNGGVSSATVDGHVRALLTLARTSPSSRATKGQ